MSQPLDDTASSSQDPLADDPLDPIFTEDTLRALAAALPSADTDTAEQKHRRRAAAFIALQSFDAQDPVEAMLATQAVVAHHFAMECYRRAARSSQTPNLDTSLLGTAALLSRTMNVSLRTMEQRQDGPVWVGKPDDLP